MIKGQATFNYIDKVVGVTKNGEKYISLNVLSKDNEKINFISKDETLINKIGALNITKFSPIKLNFETNRVFNCEKRVSYWTVELIGVD